MPRTSKRPEIPPVGGLETLTGSADPVAASPDPERAPGQTPHRSRAKVTDPSEIQPRRRENRSADLAVKVFVYFSREDEETLRALTEEWQCSRSELLRVLVRRARAQHLRE